MGVVRVRLVVPSSYIILISYFVGRGRTDGRTRVGLVVGPLMHGRRKDTCAYMYTYNSISCT
jgi:hypothetical protein